MKLDRTVKMTAKMKNAWRIARTVMWSFFGIRNSKGHANDAVTLSLQHIIIAGVIGGILFVVTILTSVNLIVAAIG
jgi:hypothetical protein